MAKRPQPNKNSAGAQQRKQARKAERFTGLGRVSALVSDLGGQHTSATLTRAWVNASEKKAMRGRNRAAALDHAAQVAKSRRGEKQPASNLIRGPVQVTRNGKTHIEQRLIRAEPKQRGRTKRDR